MCLELIKDYPEEMDDMIACYCIGWALTKEDVEEYPQLVPASGETDTGVVVCFSSEAEEITIRSLFRRAAGHIVLIR